MTRLRQSQVLSDKVGYRYIGPHILEEIAGAADDEAERGRALEEAEALPWTDFMAARARAPAAAGQGWPDLAEPERLVTIAEDAHLQPTARHLKTVLEGD